LIDECTPLADVAVAVAAALREIDYDPIVVGGSAATSTYPRRIARATWTWWSLAVWTTRARSTVRCSALGFRLTPGHFFAHQRSPFTVGFVPSPVAIGGDVISEFATVSTTQGDVRVLHVEDVVADRLNKYVCYADQDSFGVAVAVARSKKVSLDQVAAFIKRQAVGVMADPFNAPLTVCVNG